MNEKPMFTVKIRHALSTEHEGDEYTFTVRGPTAGILELIAIDSEPAVIAFVHADHPGEAAQRAWDKGQEEMRALRALRQQPLPEPAPRPRLTTEEMQRIGAEVHAEFLEVLEETRKRGAELDALSRAK